MTSHSLSFHHLVSTPRARLIHWQSLTLDATITCHTPLSEDSFFLNVCFLRDHFLSRTHCASHKSSHLFPDLTTTPADHDRTILLICSPVNNVVAGIAHYLTSIFDCSGHILAASPVTQGSGLSDRTATIPHTGSLLFHRALPFSSHPY